MSAYRGIDFSDLNKKLYQHGYPVTTDDLIDEYSNYEIEHPNNTEIFRGVLDPLTEQENYVFDSANAVRQMVLNIVDSKAAGRQRYSNRKTEHVQDEEESL